MSQTSIDKDEDLDVVATPEEIEAAFIAAIHQEPLRVFTNNREEYEYHNKSEIWLKDKILSGRQIQPGEVIYLVTESQALPAVVVSFTDPKKGLSEIIAKKV